MRTIIPPNAKLLPPQAKRVFTGMIFDIYQWQQPMFDGTTETFEMLKRPDTVKVIVVKDGKIVLLEEQQPHQSPFVDLPGGRHDHEEETELAAAQRELLEETGMAFANWRLLDATQPHTKIDWLVYVFLATDFVSQTKQTLDAGEKINVTLIEFDALKDLANNPKTRYLPREILDKAESLEQLLALPAYS